MSYIIENTATANNGSVGIFILKFPLTLYSNEKGNNKAIDISK